MRNCLCIFAAILCTISFTIAAIIEVPDDYSTIQEAVNAAQSGDEIVVAQGTYQPVLIEDKYDLTIRGAGFLGAIKTIIHGSDIHRGMEIHDCVKIIIIGLEITNCWEECINVLNSQEIYILDNYLHDCNDPVGNGLHFSQCNGALVKRNIITDHYYCSIYINAYPAGGPHCQNIQIINNTLAYNYTVDGLIIAYQDSGFVFKNNICVYNDEYGVRFKLFNQTCAELNYNDVYGNGYGNWSNSTPGIGCLSTDPLFTGGTGAEAYFLNPNSPCIDAGDPAMLDPDSTRSDIGALYYAQGNPGDVRIELTPYQTPIVVPVQGGAFDYNVSIFNNSMVAEFFDAWVFLTLPSGIQYGPIIRRENLYLQHGASIVRDLTMRISAMAMSGDYWLCGFVGNYPDYVADADSFTFEKQAFTDEIGLTSPYWIMSGWGEDEIFAPPIGKIPCRMKITANPNPFNPETVIDYILPENGQTAVKIFDITGREAAILSDGFCQAGAHQVVWNAGDFASGVYFVTVGNGGFTEVKKLILMK